MKRIMALLCGVLLVGCGNNNAPAVSQQDQTQQEVIKDEASQQDKENQETTVEEKDEVETDESTGIHIETEGFVENMDKIFTDLDDYEGKTLTYEGALIQTEEETNQYAVARVYEMNHDDHSHSMYVGLEATYEGEWPEVDSWVKVTGTIQRANSGGEDYPVLHVTEITVMPEKGQLNVIN